MHDLVIGVGNSFNTDVSHFRPESFSRCAHFQGDFPNTASERAFPCEEVHSGRYLSIHILDDGLLGGTDNDLDTLSLCEVEVFGAPGISIYTDPLGAKHGYFLVCVHSVHLSSSIFSSMCEAYFPVCAHSMHLSGIVIECMCSFYTIA